MEESLVDETPHDRPMSLVDHLSELRSRIFWSLLAWVVASTVCYFYTPTLLSLVRPLLGPKAELIFTGPTEAFFAYLKLAMVAGLFIAAPVILYNVAMFVLPGLTVRERRWLISMLPMSIVLFVVGGVFAYYVVLPTTMGFFMSYATPDLKAQIRIDEFMGFVTGLLLICGLMFQLPLVLLFLANLGLVSSRGLSRQRRLAVFVAFLVAALATPTPDAMTCTVVALPIYLLFEFSLILMRITGK
ncbi:twin-arginine translocase subunit TatC [bacterium CPR1]|nr:twin-arginine translocase subunit TatC [bacterium CPR1]